MEFHLEQSKGFDIRLNGQPILTHTHEKPLFHVGTCKSLYHMRLGHFVVQHETETKVALEIKSVKEIKSSEIYQITFADEKKLYELDLQFTVKSEQIHIEFASTSVSKYIQSIVEGDDLIERDRNSVDDSDSTHLWFSLEALPFNEENIRGCGLQYSAGDLRHKRIPIWVSEWYHDQLYSNSDKNLRPPLNTTYHPQPMFHSSRGYQFCAYGSAYAQFDFTNENFHQFHFSSMPYRLELNINGGNQFHRLYSPLPEWIFNGIILGIQGGTEVIDTKLRRMHENGTMIAAVWAQDWCGKRITSFGKRVFWNWKWNENWYPNLDKKIEEWQRNYNGCRFLAYINPYIATDGSLFEEANKNNYLVKRLDPQDTVYLIDFGEFNGAIVDLTNPKAFEWYKNVIKTNLIDLGISGWMADFGEYLPCDISVHANIPGPLVHNLWPILWARCNHQAIRDAGKSDEIIFFMRSGYLNVQRYCPLFWTGDQAVNFSLDCGLAAGVRSCLSLSLSNILNVHTDIGGYFGRTFQRSRELLLRWCEMAAFNVVMRTHEGNRPTENVQFDNDPHCIDFFARMSQVHFHLKPYIEQVVKSAYEAQRSCVTRHSELQFFLGNDLLIAPVVESEVTKWKVSIPDGEWIHIWTNQIFQKSICEIDAPLGRPPVFYRSTSSWKSLFQELQQICIKL